MAIDPKDPRIQMYKVTNKVLTTPEGIVKHPGGFMSKELAEYFKYEHCVAVDWDGNELGAAPVIGKILKASPVPKASDPDEDKSATMNKMERFAEMEKETERQQVWKPGTTLEVPGMNADIPIERKALGLAADTTADVPKAGRGKGKRGQRDITVSDAPAVAPEAPAAE